MLDFSRVTYSSSSFFSSLFAFVPGLLAREPTQTYHDKMVGTATAVARTAASSTASVNAASSTLSAAEVFDSVGAAYEDAFTGLPTQAAAVDWVAKQLAAVTAATGAPGRVVDVGCGTGRPACSVLAAAGHDVLGIDISAEMLRAARDRVPAARFELLDVRQFITREVAAGRVGARAALDAVTIFFSLIADVTQAEIRAILVGLAALIKPGGCLVFSTVPIPAENEPIRWMGRPLVVSSLAPADAIAAVRDAGLDVAYHGLTTFKPRGAEVGICAPEDVWEETHLFIYARKPLV